MALESYVEEAPVATYPYVPAVQQAQPVPQVKLETKSSKKLTIKIKLSKLFKHDVDVKSYKKPRVSLMLDESSEDEVPEGFKHRKNRHIEPFGTPPLATLTYG
jgi:hypothetical protein